MREPCDLGQALDHLRLQISGVEGAIERAQECRCPSDVDLTLALTAMLRAYQFASESEWRLTHLLEEENDGIFRFGLHGVVDLNDTVQQQVDAIFASARLDWCNDATARSYGYERRQDVIGKWAWELMPPDVPENVRCIQLCVENNYRLTDVVSVETCADGSVQRFTNSIIGRVENGRLSAVWGSFRKVPNPGDEVDMTAMLHHLQQLQCSGQLPRQIQTELGRMSQKLQQLCGGIKH